MAAIIPPNLTHFGGLFIRLPTGWHCHKSSNRQRGRPSQHGSLILHQIHGKGHFKITFITAYNPDFTSGDKTTWQQQTCLLSAALCRHNLPLLTNPHRQLVLQSWIHHLIQMGHKIVLSMDANESMTQKPLALPTNSYSLRVYLQ